VGITGEKKSKITGRRNLLEDKFVGKGRGALLRKIKRRGINGRELGAWCDIKPKFQPRKGSPNAEKVDIKRCGKLKKRLNAGRKATPTFVKEELKRGNWKTFSIRRIRKLTKRSAGVLRRTDS